MSKNPYAAPAAPVPPPIRKPSKVGLRHYFLLLFTWLVGLYVVQAWPVLWLVASSDAHGMLIVYWP